MVRKFIALRFKNICSYGNKLTEVSFVNDLGFNLLTGVTGSGKSTLLEALTYALYGEPYRDINLDELINSTNGSELLTECEFVAGDDKIKVVRGMKPKVFAIYRNGVKQEMLGSSALNQTELDKIIGIDCKMFRQIVALATSYNKPFLKMKLQEKREVVESIFNVRIFGVMLDEVKDQVKDIKKNQMISVERIKVMEESLTGARKNLIEMKKAKESFISTKTSDIKAIDDRILLIKSQRSALDAQITCLTNEISSIKAAHDAKEISLADVRRLSELNKETDITLCFKPEAVVKNNEKINQLQIEIRGFENDLVPDSDVTDKKSSALENEISDLKLQIAELKNGSLITISPEMTTLQNDRNVLNNELSALLAESVNLTQLKITFQSNIDAENKTIESLRSRIAVADKEISLYNDNVNFLLDEQATCPILSTECFADKQIKNSKINDINQLIALKLHDKNNAGVGIQGCELKREKLRKQLDEAIVKEKKIEKLNMEIKDLGVLFDIKDVEHKNKISHQIKEYEHIIEIKTQLLIDKSNEIKNAISKHKSDIKLLESDNVNIYAVQKAELEKKINSINERYNKLKSELLLSEQELDNKTNLMRSIIDKDIPRIDESIKSFEAQRSEISLREFTADIESMEKEFALKLDEYKDVVRNEKEQAESLRLYDLCSKVLSDGGVKSYFFSKLMPVLNERINEYLPKFGIPARLTFDEVMNEKMVNLLDPRTNRSYNSFSEGQKKSFDLSIMFSFMDIAALICSWTSNILFIDEMLDGAVSIGILDKIISVLKEIVKDRGNETVFVISHRVDDNLKNLFDGIFQVQDAGGFSQLMKIT